MMTNGACISNDGKKWVDFEGVGGFFLNDTVDSATQIISAHSMEKQNIRLSPVSHADGIRTQSSFGSNILHKTLQ